MNSCDARIRPFRTFSELEIVCEVEGDGRHKAHQGTIRDYAYKGSKTIISWADDDRRCFHGDWPGRCIGLFPLSCLLPSGHTGNHAP